MLCGMRTGLVAMASGVYPFELSSKDHEPCAGLSFWSFGPAASSSAFSFALASLASSSIIDPVCAHFAGQGLVQTEARPNSRANKERSLLPDLLPNSVARAGTNADDGSTIARNARQIGSLRDRRNLAETEAIELGNRCSILLSYGTSTGRCSIADGATHPLG